MLVGLQSCRFLKHRPNRTIEATQDVDPLD